MREGGAGIIKVASAGTVQLGTWNHTVVVYSNGQLSIALNGVLKGTVSTTFGEFDKHSNAASMCSPGLNSVNSNTYFVGLIDDLRIWDGTAFTAQQIADLYAQGVMSPAMNITHQRAFDGDVSDSVSGMVGTLQGGMTAYSSDAIEASSSLSLPCCNSSALLNSTLLKNAFTYYTVSLWFRANSTGGYRYLYKEGSSSTGFAIRLNNSTLEAGMIEGGGGVKNIKVASAGAIATVLV